MESFRRLTSLTRWPALLLALVLLGGVQLDLSHNHGDTLAIIDCDICQQHHTPLPPSVVSAVPQASQSTQVWIFQPQVVFVPALAPFLTRAPPTYS